MRFWHDLIGRTDGPFTFRFVLQPLMAAIYASRDGIRDAHEGRSFYLRTLFARSSDRWPLLYEGWAAVTRILALGVVMDVAYQLIVFRWIYPLELVAIVLLLAFVPYVLLRGPVNRFARRVMLRRSV